MESRLKVDFPSSLEAGKALKILGKGCKSPKASVALKQRGSILEIVVEARDFAALRARTTSILRDVKVVIDSFKLVGKQICKSKL